MKQQWKMLAGIEKNTNRRSRGSARIFVPEMAINLARDGYPAMSSVDSHPCLNGTSCALQLQPVASASSGV
jgi:hypothetical protein